FDVYRTSVYNPDLPPTPPPSMPRSAIRPSSILDDFRKGIKRDKAHYQVFKEDKQWDSWRRSTLATARSHACEDVFDPSYRPSNHDEAAVFTEKQKFIYSVFE
ncbi:hypothetical protein, partial [Salmonella enterica]|uniref:hypothetical protein n=1 Tax=Salmonella enterica TaxID=28901 RepID=UPI0035258305